MSREEDVARWVGGDIGRFSRVVGRPLRHYQLEAARSIVRSVRLGQGRTFTVVKAAQSECFGRQTSCSELRRSGQPSRSM